MVRASDDTENFIATGMITILPHPILSYGDGSIEVQGEVFTDSITANTIGGPVNLETMLFKDGGYTMPTYTDTLVAPAVGSYLFFYNNNLLQSIDSNNILTTYAPQTTKGDISVHNGTTEVRLGTIKDGQLLVSNSGESTGLNWYDPGNAVARQYFTLANTVPSNIINQVYGAFYACIQANNQNGPTGNAFFSKSTDSIQGHTVMLAAAPSATQHAIMSNDFPPYQSPNISKTNSTEGDGDYALVSNYNLFQNKLTLTLTGTAPTTLTAPFAGLNGGYFVTVYSSNGGPCATFMLCKSSSAYSVPAITQLTISPSLAGSKLNFAWPAGSPVTINKTTVSDDGSYFIYDPFFNKITTTITLTGTTPVTISSSLFRYYTNKGFLCRVYSGIDNYPVVLAAISKNVANSTAPSAVLNAAGASTREIITVTWGNNSLITVAKSGTNYDGVYTFDMTVVYPA